MDKARKKKDKTTTFVPDKPLTDPAVDLFDRWPFSKRLAQAIASRSDPSSLVVAIYGAWGEGKTTVLNFVEKELTQYEHILCIRFNPWRFGDETQLLLSFFSLLAESLGESLKTQRERFGDFLQKYASIVSPLSLSLGGIGVSPGQSAVEIGKQLSGVELHELRHRIERVLSDCNKRVVILMDDIDRLDKSEIYTVFKLVKLTADFDHTAYVLAFDDVMVANALQERYSSGKTESGFSFLEKIVQVPLNLPHAHPIELRRLCFQSVDSALSDSSVTLNEQQVQSFVRDFEDGLEVRLKTPRMCKRYGNALSFALPILKGEVNPVDLMLIEGMRVFYPTLYAVVRDNPQIFIGSIDHHSDTKKLKEKTEAVILSVLKHFTDQESESAKKLLQAIFPKVYGLLGETRYGPDWHERWAREQRICSPNYFNRYFTYAVPADDVSDTVMQNFIDDLAKQSVETIVQNLHRIVDARNASKVIFKLRERENDLNEHDSILLSRAIVVLGELFPNPEQIFSFQNAWSQAAIFVHKLLLNVKENQRRLELAKELIRDSTPLPFCIECLRWMRSSDEKPDEERTFDKAGDTELGSLAATRIKEEAKGKNLLNEYGDDVMFLLLIWSHYGGNEEVSSYLQKLFCEDGTNVIKFLMSCLPSAVGLESGIYHKGDFRREQYDNIESFIDPVIIFDKLVEKFGDQLNTVKAGFSESYDLPVEKKVAFQYAGIFNYVKKERETQTDVGDAVNEE